MQVLLRGAMASCKRVWSYVCMCVYRAASSVVPCFSPLAPLLTSKIDGSESLVLLQGICHCHSTLITNAVGCNTMGLTHHLALSEKPPHACAATVCVCMHVDTPNYPVAMHHQCILSCMHPLSPHLLAPQRGHTHILYDASRGVCVYLSHHLHSHSRQLLL